MVDLSPPLPAAVRLPLQAFAQRYHLLTLPLHAHQIAGAFIVYEAIFLFLSPALSIWLLPSIYRDFPRRTKNNWNIRVVSTIQATFICVVALHVIFSDGSRQYVGWEERLWSYSASGGAVQAFAAGYFMWDVYISAANVDFLGIGSLVHAICALLITSLGFVSSLISNATTLEI